MIKKNSQYTFLTTLVDACEERGREVPCRCVCGKELLVNVYALTHNRVISCGCKTQSKIVVGQTYGGWEVLSKCAPNSFLCKNERGQRVLTQSRLIRYMHKPARRYKSSVMVINPRTLKYHLFRDVKQMREAFSLTQRQAYWLLKQHTTRTFPYTVYFSDQVPCVAELKAQAKRKRRKT